MEKEKGLKKTEEPSADFLRAMVLLENMEMLRMMEEFHLDQGKSGSGPGKPVPAAGSEKK
jgi:hypothetical protein